MMTIKLTFNEDELEGIKTTLDVYAENNICTPLEKEHSDMFVPFLQEIFETMREKFGSGE